MMKKLPLNTTNYYLTEHGVINRQDTFWDNLQLITSKLEHITQNMVKTLFYIFAVSMFSTVLTLWFNLERSLSILLLGLIVIFVVLAVIKSYLTFLSFFEIRKKGMILYDELGKELDKEAQIRIDDEAPLEERIILGNFMIAGELPVNKGIYLMLLALLPFINLTFLILYYWWLK